MVYIFLLRFPVAIFSGLVGEAASPPIVFTPALWRRFHMIIGFVYFYNVSFRNLSLLEKTWGLCSILKGSSFRSSLSDIFTDEALNFQQDISPDNICASFWGFYLRSIFLAVSSLVARLSSMSKLYSLLRDLLHSWGSLWWFNLSEVFGWKCLLTVSGVLGSLIWLTYFFTGFMTEKV